MALVLHFRYTSLMFNFYCMSLILKFYCMSLVFDFCCTHFVLHNFGAGILFYDYELVLHTSPT